MSSRDIPSSPGRAVLVNAARERWIERLIDLTRRNNLLYFRDLRTGTLDLGATDPAVLADFWAGSAVPLAKLVPGADETRIAASGQEIRRRAATNREERGLETLYVAAGMATWTPDDEGRPTAAPILLVPVGLETRGRDGRTMAIRRAEEGDIQANLVLLHALQAEHGVEVTPESILEALAPPASDSPPPFDPAPAFARLAELARTVPGFTVAPRIVLGNFSFQKMAMVNDLRAHGETLESNDLVAAIAGDVPARQSILTARTPIDPATLDATSPDREFLILDADSTQQRVIAAVLAAQDGVIQGPPGTGKSQTISNLIAELVSRGKRVLFVAEKRAALDVVLKRLDVSGLGHLALDLHGAEITRKEVMKRLAESFVIVRESAPVDAAALHARVEDRRRLLNEHAARLHRQRPPGGLSVYDLLGRLGEADAAPAEGLSTRWRDAGLDRLDLPAVTRIRDLLVEAAGFSALFLRTDPSPWTGAALTTGNEVQKATDTARRLVNSSWPALEKVMRSTAGAPEPETIGAAVRKLGLSIEAARLSQIYSEGLFEADLDRLAGDLLPAGKGGLTRLLAGLFNGNYRRARREAAALRRSAVLQPGTLLEEITAARDLLAAWRKDVPAGKPVAIVDPDAAAAALQTVTGDLAGMKAHLNRDLELRPFTEAAALFSALAADTATPHRLPRLLEIEGSLTDAGVADLVTELRKNKPDPSLWPGLFERAWIASSFDRARFEDPAIAGFNGRTHDGIAREFARLDRERLGLAAGRVRRAHAERAIEAMNRHPDQEALVRREAAKKSRHLPVRSLLAQAPEVLTALRPCWMASPLQVSQLLDGRRYFDVVLFDEASQVLPEDAIPALMRAERAVVAGDRHQLPPTAFFMAGDDEEAESTDAAAEGFESLLDIMGSFLDPWSLDWHYRSRDESLIAFSNQHIYGEKLVTFPGPGGSPVLSHVLVEGSAEDAGAARTVAPPAAPPGATEPFGVSPASADAGASPPAPGESSAAEVRRVVELILDHAANRPMESLGVIAMGVPHARRIEEALEHEVRAHPALQPFFDPARPDRFFIKNLERVQGDERDAIILTVGYGKDRNGKLPYRFGPLLMQGGERRLNVAVTRARKRLTLVSSFSHADMDPGRSTAKGVELLRLYLQYASGGGHRFDAGGAIARKLDPFQESVLSELTRRGLRVEPQWGASKHRIDFAVRDPNDPSRFALAIECDGPEYAASPTARDRDRLRPQHLEGLGWRHHRIWSLDWHSRLEEEIELCMMAYRAAIGAGSVSTGTPPTASSSATAAGPLPAPAARSTPDVNPPARRGQRPIFPRAGDIDDYTPRQIDALLGWIQSDGRLRTDDEVIDEMTEALGFKRRGSRIEAVVIEAIHKRRGGD